MKKILLYLIFSLLLLAGLAAQDLSYPKSDNALRIISYNIRNAKGMDLKTDYSRIANVITGLAPDIVAVQEVDNATNRSKGIDVMAELASLTGMHSVFGAAIDYDGGQYGVGILSKEQPISHHNIPLPGREEARTILAAEFDKYVLACTHWSLTKEDRIASVAIVNELTKLYDKPVFMAGDFNMEPESVEFQLLSKNWKVLNSLKKYTFPADNPDRCIDYIFVYSAAESLVKLLQGNVLGEPIASDHRPLFVDIELL